MNRCKNCLMPNTKPGLVLDSEGICQACRHAEQKEKTDWEGRYKELEELCDKYKRTDGKYDCIIAVSGGKDSHFQVHVIKNLMKMNPLLVSVGDPFTHTKAGIHNIKNIAEAFDCDMITANISPALVRRMVRIAFKEFGSPTWPIDRAIYSFPIQTAIEKDIPLVFYGENVAYEYGGVQQEETPSALNQIENDVAKKIDWNLWYKNGITESQLNLMKYPSHQDITKAELNPVYLSYFMKWDGYKNYIIAKEHGFKDLEGEWIRWGYIENYDQIDSIAYLMNVWLKWPKFGFCRVTDVVGYWIRSDEIANENWVDLIKAYDGKLDPRIQADFLDFTGYSHEEFWNIVEKFWNREIFEKIDGEWKLKDDGL